MGFLRRSDKSGCGLTSCFWISRAVRNGWRAVGLERTLCPEGRGLHHPHPAQAWVRVSTGFVPVSSFILRSSRPHLCSLCSDSDTHSHAHCQPEFIIFTHPIVLPNLDYIINTVPIADREPNPITLCYLHSIGISITEPHRHLFPFSVLDTHTNTLFHTFDIAYIDVHTISLTFHKPISNFIPISISIHDGNTIGICQSNCNPECITNSDTHNHADPIRHPIAISVLHPDPVIIDISHPNAVSHIVPIIFTDHIPLSITIGYTKRIPNTDAILIAVGESVGFAISITYPICNVNCIPNFVTIINPDYVANHITNHVPNHITH